MCVAYIGFNWNVYISTDHGFLAYLSDAFKLMAQTARSQLIKKTYHMTYTISTAELSEKDENV